MDVCSELLDSLDHSIIISDLEMAGSLRSRGVLQRAKQLFRADHHRAERKRSESLRSARDSVQRLADDWSFLKMFAEVVQRGSGGREEQPMMKMMNQGGGGESVVSRIEAAWEEIEKILGKYAGDRKKCHRFVRLDKLLKEISDCQRKTDEDLKVGIEEAFEDYSSELQIRVLSPDIDFWLQFLGSVAWILWRIQRRILDSEEVFLELQISSLRNEVERFEKYLSNLRDLERHYTPCPSFRGIHDHIAYSIPTIAYRSCAFWFNRRRRTDPETARILVTGIVNLHPEIDPTAPAVIKLLLGFEEKYYQSQSWNSNFLDNFCDYLLEWRVGEGGLGWELRSLVTLFYNRTLKDDGSSAALDDTQSLFEEIYAVLAEAALLHRHVLGYRDTENLPCRRELLVKICLLKAELFLKEHLNVSSSSMLSKEDPFFKVDMFLENLRGFEKYPCRENRTEYMEQSLVISKELAEEFTSLLASLQSRKIADPLVKHLLFQLIFKIVFFKGESFLTVLSKIIDPSMAHSKDQVDFLIQKLKCFKLIVITKPVTNSHDEEMILALIEAVTRRITLLSYSFLPNNDILRNIVASLPQLLNRVEVIMGKFQEISAHFPNSDFPKTHQVGFIDSLGRSIKELLKYDPVSIAQWKPHLEVVQQHLVSWESFLSKLLDSDVEQEDQNDLGNRIMRVAYKLEYVIESIEVEAHLQHSIMLCDLLEDISLVNHEIFSIHEPTYSSKLQNLPLVAGEMMTWNSAPPAIDEMEVDLVDEENVIIGRLIGGLSRRDVVSIVGMPGSGKTTLAKKTYNDRKVMYHFHRRAWCTVSQVYSKRDLLLEILRDIHGFTDEIHQMSDDDLLSRVRRCLLRNKYLIVMDDVWDIAALNDLQNVFPDDSNGSRILITSRLWEVALKTNPASDPHPIRLLSNDESWMLFEKKIFKGNACPQELLHIGKEIAHHCQGLPLAIVAIAGLLQQTEKTLDSWERISKSISSYIIDDPESQCMKVLELSYKHLPHHLKPCFLYLGVFLEDKDIPVSKLIQLWTAEGFVQEAESKCLEDVAEDCLMNLINRSLVTISKRRSNGKVKACRLHDLLRDLCHSKAKEENFLHLVTRYDEPYASYPDSDFGMEFVNYSKSAPLTFESYRLSMYLKRSHFFHSMPSGPYTRSLIFFARIDSEPRRPYDISFIFQNFKLLRLLDLECINIGVNFPVDIGLMVQLRYLAVIGYFNSIPPSISNLWKLETLLVKGLGGKVILPDTIWSMAKLRHLHVNNLVAFNLGDHGERLVGSSIYLNNLVSFSTPLLSCGKDTEKILRRLRNLRKLRCVWYSSEECKEFPNFDFLTNLDSLKIIYHGIPLDSVQFVLPYNLKKLTLSTFRLPWNHISSIASLPNLRVLKLLEGAFEGEVWEMREEEFKELKFLELNDLNIVEWNATSDHLPNLEQLVLRKCKDLEKIPFELACISTLQMIEVQWCKQSVEESAKEIGDVTGEIKILVTRS